MHFDPRSLTRIMSDSDVAAYLREISHFPLLTKEQEQELAHRIADGDADAREEMIRSNLRLVVSIAKKYANHGLPLLDLVAEGNFGLMKAVERFRAEEDKRFSTYASWWIKQAIRRALAAKVKNVRVPTYMVDIVNRWRRASNELSQEFERDATPREIAKRISISEDKIEVIQKALGAANSSSFNAPRVTDPDGMLGDIEELLARAGKDIQPEALFTDHEEEKLELLLGCLDDRARTVIRYRYGINTREVLTLERIGERKLKKKITRERVRQIETQALREMLDILREEEESI